jgi:hypothetical protein
MLIAILLFTFFNFIVSLVSILGHIVSAKLNHDTKKHFENLIKNEEFKNDNE